MNCENCMLPGAKCKCEDGPLVECKNHIEAVQIGTVFTGEWGCECGATGEFGTGTEHFIPYIPSTLINIIEEIRQLRRVNKAARRAVYNCTLATGIGYWQELADAVFEYEADDRGV